MTKVMHHELVFILLVPVLSIIPYLSFPPGFDGWVAILFLYTGLIIMVSSVISSGRFAGIWDHKRQAVDRHLGYVTILISCVLTGVVGIVVSILKSGGGGGDPFTRNVHRLIVLAVVSLFCVAYYKHTGLKDPKRHKSVVYTLMTFYALACITGTLLQQDKFPLEKTLAAIGKR